METIKEEAEPKASSTFFFISDRCVDSIFLNYVNLLSPITFPLFLNNFQLKFIAWFQIQCAKISPPHVDNEDASILLRTGFGINFYTDTVFFQW